MWLDNDRTRLANGKLNSVAYTFQLNWNIFDFSNGFEFDHLSATKADLT